MMYLDSDSDIYWEGARLNYARVPSYWKPPEYWDSFEHSDYTSVLLLKEYMK